MPTCYRVSSQLLYSVLFIVVPNNIENSNFFLEKVARLLLFLIHVLKGSYSFSGRQYTSFLKDPLC